MDKEDYTRYERARLLGARSLQISLGAPVMVDAPADAEPIDIAREELEEDVIPLTVRRPQGHRKPTFPSGEKAGVSEEG